MQNGPAQRAVGPVAIAAVALAAALAALSTFGDHSGNSSHDGREFLIVLAIVAVGAAVVFGFVVPRGLGREAVGTAAIILSVLGLLTVAVFWSGLPPVFAAVGILLGWAGRNADRGRMLCRIALAIGVLALAGDVAVALGDWLSNR